MGILRVARVLWVSLLVTVPAIGQRRQEMQPERLQEQLESLEGAARIPVLVDLARIRRQDSSLLLETTAEALELLAEHPDVDLEARARAHRSWALQARADYPAARDEAMRAEALARTLDKPLLLALTLYQRAVVAWRMSEHEQALQFARQARTIQEQQGGKRRLSRTWTLLGAIHRSLGRLDTSLSCHLEALKISEAEGHTAAAARSHNNIGLVYWHLERHEDAHAAILQSLRINEAEGRPIATNLSNLGLISIELDRPTEALGYLERALPLMEASGNLHGQAKCQSNIGFAHASLGHLDAALVQFGRSLTLRQEIGDKEGIVRSLGSIADVHQRKGDHARAVEMLEEALALAEEIQAKDEQAALYRHLSEARAALGDPERALEDFRQHHRISQEVRGAATRERIAAIELRHEREKRAHEIAEMAALASRNSAELERQSEAQKNLWIGSGALAATLLLLVGLHFSRSRALRALRTSHDSLQQATGRLAESEQRYRMLFEGCDVPTLLIDPERRQVLDRNVAARVLDGGATESDVLEVSALEPEWVRGAVTHLLEEEELVSGEPTLDDCWVERGGRLRWTEVRGTWVFWDGRRCLLLGVRDVTDHREAEAARMRADRLESLGVLAGGIAHDFNNALTSILGHVGLAKDKGSAAAAANLDLAERAASQAARLTSQLLAFAKGGTSVRRPRDVKPLLCEAVELAGAGSQMRIEFDIAEDLDPVSVDSGQFRQVVSNLVINADQATGAGGVLTVRARKVGGDSAGLGSGTDYVRIDFQDNGSGIPEEHRDHVFDPYFTTKDGGSGLGLATAYAITRHHEGTLRFENAHGGGTRFSAFFPIASGPAQEPLLTQPPTPKGKGSILVLEDEELVQSVYRQMLEQWGYSVTVASEGSESVQRFRERHEAGRSFDLLIMDLTIPGGMGGRDAMEEIRKIDPDVRAIVSSGYSEDPTMAHFRDSGFVAALPKPFRQAELARVVQEVLSHPA